MSTNLYSVLASEFEAIQLPKIVELKNKEWVYYGEDNLFPQTLVDLFNSSAIHHTCVLAIKDGIYGEGIETFGSEYVNGKGETLNEVYEKIALDYSLYQGFALNVIWNVEGTRIAEIYHLPFANVRSGKPNEEDEVEEYFYSSDWRQIKKYKPHSYRSFDVTDNKGDNASQVYYCYNYTPGNDVYPLPAYIGALNDIQLDGRVSKFHNANISNGLAPSLFIKFRNGIPTPEERDDLYREIERTFSGENNAGRFFLSFSEPGNEMQVEPIQAANDDYYITLETRITSRILTSHRITSPLLLGVKVEGNGFSSNADEIVIAYSHFENTVIEPMRKKVLSNLGYVFKLMGNNVILTVIPNKVVNDITGETVIEETQSEI